MRIAIIFHCFYIDLIDEFFVYFKKIKKPYTLFVTLPSDVYTSEEIEHVTQKILHFKSDTVLLSCKNYGADIFPCFATMDYIRRNDLHFDKYVKVHTKKSLRKEDKTHGAVWRRNLCAAIFDNFQSNLKLPGLVSSKIHSHSFTKSKSLFRKGYIKGVFDFYGYDSEKIRPDQTTSCGTMFMVDGDVWEDFFLRNAKKPINLCYFANRDFCITFERLWHILPLFYNKPINFV